MYIWAKLHLFVLLLYAAVENIAYAWSRSLYFLISAIHKLECTYQRLQRSIISAKICDIFHSMFYWPISKHLYSGIFKEPLDTKHKIFKKILNSWMLCFVFKIGVFVELNPWMGIIFIKWPWDGTLKMYRKNVACCAGSTTLWKEISSLCSLWYILNIFLI